MSRPIINLDVDGVLTNGFADLVIQMLWLKGIKYPGKGWDLLSFAPSHNARQEMLQQLRKCGIAISFVPREGAREFVDRLRRWAQIRFVTSPFDGSPTWAFERESWLIERMRAKPDEIAHVRDKGMVNGHALLDDRVKNLRAFHDANPGATPILWDAYDTDPWGGWSVTNFEHAERLLLTVREP